MIKIQINPIWERNIFSSWDDYTSLYTVTYATFPFTEGFLTKRQWRDFYCEKSEFAIGDLISKYKLLNEPHYLVGKTLHNKLVIKFSNGLYSLYGTDTKYEEVGISLPDELFTM